MPGGFLGRRLFRQNAGHGHVKFKWEVWYKVGPPRADRWMKGAPFSVQRTHESWMTFRSNEPTKEMMGHVSLCNFQPKTKKRKTQWHLTHIQLDFRTIWEFHHCCLSFFICAWRRYLSQLTCVLTRISLRFRFFFTARRVNAEPTRPFSQATRDAPLEIGRRWCLLMLHFFAKKNIEKNTCLKKKNLSLLPCHGI